MNNIFNFEKCSLKNGVHYNAVGTLRTIDVGTNYPNNSNNPGNAFLNSTNGIYLQGRISSTITQNTFNGITNGLAPLFFPGYSASCIASATGAFHTVNIVDNRFTGFNNGVYIYNKRTCNVNVTDNFFNATSSLTGTNGIRIERVTSNNLLNNITVARNELYNITQNGILVNIERNVNITDNNPIEMVSPANPQSARARAGIHLINTENCTVNTNLVDVTTHANPTAAIDDRVFGIWVESTTGLPNKLSSNHVKHLGNGIRFYNSITNQTIECNEIEANWTGIKMWAPCNIGDQVILQNSTTKDQNNHWVGTSSLPPNTNIFGVLMPGYSINSSIWYSTRPATANDYYLDPSQMNGFANVMFSPTTLSNNCVSAPLLPNQSSLEDFVLEKGYFDSIATPGKYWAQRQMFDLLMNADSLMLQGTIEDTILRNWYDSTSIASLGLLTKVNDSLDVNTEYAIELNESVTPTNPAEENEQLVNSIYGETFALDNLQLDSIQYETLYSIATENSMVGGPATYKARAMLGLLLDESIDEEESRYGNNTANTEPYFSGKLYPNPTNNTVFYDNSLVDKESGIIQLQDLTGRILIKKQLVEGENHIGFNVAEYAPGMYLIKVIIDGRGFETTKLMLK